MGGPLSKWFKVPSLAERSAVQGIRDDWSGPPNERRSPGSPIAGCTTSPLS